MVKIPHLTCQMYLAGSQWRADVPRLVKSQVHDDGRFDFKWKATGSKTYTVTASGKLDPNIEEYRRWKGKGPKGGLNVHCTCPSYEDQDLATEQTGWRTLYVCKHLKAALDSVCDDESEGEEEDEEESEEDEDELEGEVVEDDEDDEDDEDEDEDDEEEEAGAANGEERDRLEYGLSQRTDKEVVDLIRERMETDDGLRALTKLFPANIMPPQKKRRRR